jgi:hypothetical protein
MKVFDFTEVVTPLQCVDAAFPSTDVTIYEMDGVVHITIGKNHA